jgi:hypothetical protein
VPFVLGFGVLVILAKLPTLGTAAYWDEMGYLAQAKWLSEVNLLRVVPGLHPPAAFWGHPPGLHLAAAILWKAFGPSVPVAHFLIACFAAVGVCSTFVLARSLYGLTAACLAALLLLLSPQFLAQAGFFLADIPVMSLGVLSVYLALRDRYAAYVFCASCMVLLKETSIALLAAVIAYRFLFSGRIPRERFVDTVKYSVPLVVIGAYVALQKLTTGKFFFIYDFEFDELFVLSARTAGVQFVRITRWLFLEQYRWILSLAILVNFAITPAARRRRELWLFALIALLSGYSFSVLYYWPRYLLPVMPFFYILGAVSLIELVRSSRMQAAIGVAMVALMASSLSRQRFDGNGENNLAYRHVVNMHTSLSKDIATRFPSARILTTWPTATELSDPLLGYVTRPLRVVWFNSDSDLARADLVLVSSPAPDVSARLESLARRNQWRLLAQLRNGSIVMELYGPPGP